MIEINGSILPSNLKWALLDSSFTLQSHFSCVLNRPTSRTLWFTFSWIFEAAIHIYSGLNPAEFSVYFSVTSVGNYWLDQLARWVIILATKANVLTLIRLDWRGHYASLCLIWCEAISWELSERIDWDSGFHFRNCVVNIAFWMYWMECVDLVDSLLINHLSIMRVDVIAQCLYYSPGGKM